MWLVFIFRVRNSRVKEDFSNKKQTIMKVKYIFPDGPLSRFTLTPELLETEIMTQQQLGKCVKGFIFCNPNNPLGVVYSMELTLSLMEVCRKYQVHFISDEIYALSVFDPSVKFESILSIPKEQVRKP